MDRTDFQAVLIPDGLRGGNWLDACSPFVSPILVDAAVRKGLILTTCDLDPREKAVQKLDLTHHKPDLGRFDVVTSFDTLEHIGKYKLALDSLFLYTTLGGVCIIGVPSLWDESDGDHLKIDPETHPHRHEWYFNPKRFERELIGTGFKITARWLPDNLDLHQVCCVWALTRLVS